MTGESHWLTLAVLLIGGTAILALVVIDWWADRGFREEPLHLVCPTTGASVDAVVVEDIRKHQFTGVRECSGRGKPDGRRCASDCLGPLNEPAKSPAVLRFRSRRV